jgi:DNA helicase-2/ATP-dependent DNA helicase PcrA
MSTMDLSRPRSPESTALLAALNDVQKEACLHETGPLLILAGPGSGKTRVVTSRIAWLVRECGVHPEQVLAITFTNKAAREMRERVEALLPGVSRLWIGTFHATCARILRREIECLGGWTRDFTIYDTNDKNQLLKRVLKELGLDHTRFRPAQVGGWLSSLKNARETAEDDGSFEGEALVKVARKYAEELRSANALDFDDLQLLLLQVFETQPGIRDLWSTRFKQVLVDEYQDTNRVQYDLVRHWASAHGNLTVCGDPDQSIYAWRGADVRNILDFETDFAAEHVVRLEQNYRSKGTILRAAAAVIAHNRNRPAKTLWTEEEDGELVCSIQCSDEGDEAREIAAQILALRQKGAHYGDCAVFYRANFMQRALETALRLTSVPYQIVGGVEFYARAEIRDLIAYLRLIVNPADDVAFRRVVNAPARGVGETSLTRLAEWAADRQVTLVAALASDEALSSIRGRARKGLLEFRGLLERLSAVADAPSAVALDLVLAEIDVERWLAAMEGDFDRSENVEELRSHAEEYDRAEIEGRIPGLRGFLQDVALVSEVDDLRAEVDRVVLMTLHAAKGLEFPNVFIAGVEEELLPHARALGEGGDPVAGEEEERRLFYVGMTRARERLFLTHVQARHVFGQQRFAQPSRFLDEIPADLIEGGAMPGDDEADRVSEARALGIFNPDSVGNGAQSRLRVGDRVEHEHFGPGVIEQLVGSGINARATVRFGARDTRQLLLAYANLKRREAAR